MKRITLICLLTLFTAAIGAQTKNVDSLVNVLETQKLTSQEQLEILKEICDVYKDNNIKLLVMYSEKGLQLAKADNNKLMTADFYRYKGIGYELYGKLDTSIIYYEKGLELAVETQYKECEALIYARLGSIYISENKQYRNSKIALEYYLKALQIFESIDYKKNIALTLTEIGNYHRVLRNFERANYYLQRAKTIAEEIDYDYAKMCIYYSLSDFSYDDQSIDYSMKGLEIARSINNKSYEVAFLQSLAYNYCLDKGEYDKAEEYGNECLRIAEEYGEHSSLICAWTVLSYVYLYQKRYDECKEIVLKAWEADSFNIQLSTLTNLAAAHLYLGELDEAHSFFVKYVYTMEENAGKEFQKAIADTETKYETEKKEIRIAALEKEKTLYIWLGAAGVLILLMVVILLLFRHRISIQKNKLAEQQIKQLEQEKQLIAAQAVLDGETAERSRLARDLHDGLGGMLSVVKLNLKDMKGYTILDNYDSTRFDKALEMLDQSIGELRRVAHHIMPESLMRNGLKVSLEDFCRAIPGAQFQYFGGNPRLDSRLEVLIYRCAYELINNAVKHANATSINVQLLIDNGLISLSVHDNGTGFDTEKVVSGSGLENLRVRVASYNGKMKIYSSPDKGTEVNIEIEQQS